MFAARSLPLGDYASIFNARGRDYHEAMLRVPGAREEEFRAVVDRAELAPGMCIADVPSGGGYLAGYLPEGVTYRALETSSAFYRFARDRSLDAVRVPSLRDTGLPDGSFDRVLSIAGLHHERQRGAIYREFERLLRPGGRLVVAEVQANTAVARFLNDFVDAQGDGHHGWFFDEEERSLLKQAGFQLTSWELVHYVWSAPTVEALAQYCRLMFGAHRATLRDMIAVLRSELDLASDAHGAHIRWELVVATADKLGR